MPNYWKTIKEFSGADVSVCELQTTVESMEYLSKAAFSTDNQLLKEVCKKSVGVVLISSTKKCRARDANLNTRADRPRKLVLYTETSGTLPALHYRKVCSQSSCNYTVTIHWVSLAKIVC